MELKDKWELVAWVFVVITYALNEVRKWRIKKKESHKHKHSLENDSDFRIEINNILWQLLSLYRCSRCYIMQFHNGDEFLSGQPVIRKTITHEVVYPGIKKVGPDNQGAQVSEMTHKILRKIKAEGYVYIPAVDLIEHSNEDLFNWMNVYAAKSLLIVRLIDNKTGETVATLNMHFPHNHGLNNGQIDTILQSKKRFESIFNKS